MTDPSPDREPHPDVPPQPVAPATEPTVADVQDAVMGRRRSWRDRAGKIGGGTVVAGGLGLKVLGKTALIGKFGLFTLLKFKTFLSMLVSVAAYAIFWGWRFAV